MSENLGGATEAIFAKLLTHKYFQQDTCACAALNYHSGGRSGAYTWSRALILNRIGKGSCETHGKRRRI